jgi:small-conductance mechanosensitive channel
MAEERKGSWIKTAALWICAGLFGRFFGFIGLGSAVLGYLVYKKMLESKDKSIAVLIGVGSGVMSYILVIFLIVS